MRASDPCALSTYDYALPEGLIAAEPARPRDSSRLLVVHRASGRIEHRRFTDLPEYLNSGDLMVSNNTRVLKARLLGRRLREERGQWVEGGRLEFVLLEKVAEREWEGLMRASAKYAPGLRFRVPLPEAAGGGAIEGRVVRGAAGSEHGTVIARFDRDPVEAGAGALPLPHYMEREARADDEERYQTVYGKEPGSAAAPTAGLHFTPRVLDALNAKGVRWAELTLHVGLGTFRPVKSEDIRDHVMHSERYWVPQEVAAAVEEARAASSAKTAAVKRRVLAVGTTSVRTLESAWDPETGAVRSGVGRTRLFLHPPGARFHVTQALLTNFHLPRSSLLMLVCAFGGTELVLQAYEEAVRDRYRFYSYGDAMLLL